MTKQQRQDYIETFDTVHGKRVLENLKALAHFNIGYVKRDRNDCVDIYDMCREEGKRAMIVQIERILNSDPWKEKHD